MSDRQSNIIYFLKQEPTLTAYQLSMPYRVDAPEASIRRDIRTLRGKGYQITLGSIPSSFGGRAYKLVSK